MLQLARRNATANLDLALSFYQAIVDNAGFTGSSLVLGISLLNNNQCSNPGVRYRAQTASFYMADNSSSLAARMDALGEDVVAVLRVPKVKLCLPKELGAGSASRELCLHDSRSDSPRATNSQLLCRKLTEITGLAKSPSACSQRTISWKTTTLPLCS